MTNTLENNGILILNSDKSNNTPEKTVIVIGVARSGTTMIASILKELGVFLGDAASGAVLEDPKLSRQIENGEKREVAATIASYDKRFPIWATKRPELYHHLSDYLSMFRNPHIVATFRDPIAIARRNEISMLGDPIEGLLRANEETADLIRFVRSLDCPALLASYEKASANGATFLDKLLDFLNLDPTEQERQKALDCISNGPESYLKNTHVRFEGELTSVNRRQARGWLERYPRYKPVTVEILNGRKVIGQGTLENSTPAEEGPPAKPTFCIKLKGWFNPEKVTARVANTTYIIPRSKALEM
ncbi:hypothetical protein [uncultured Cohaesibacter sp.]|uniref:hypothetical protein n=1 Tax=uncultured Cohaesibacter sp. TaxID=1002546 RepID=UPI0029C8B9D3|nr:hypothetical protein [uncultured Cohaesibacter sp.]